jgi:hypothetical protein
MFRRLRGSRAGTSARPANILIGTAGIRRQGNALERKNRVENRAQARFYRGLREVSLENHSICRGPTPLRARSARSAPK